MTANGSSPRWIPWSWRRRSWAKDIVTQIASASEQQSSASEEIGKNVEGISSVTQETARGTTQIAKVWMGNSYLIIGTNIGGKSV